jgi:hypothetical protein
MMLFPDSLNSRTWPRFKARMTPIRANIIEPPRSATRISAAMAACHSGRADSSSGSEVMKLAASRRVTNLHPTGNVIGSTRGSSRDLRSGIFLAPEHPSGREEEAQGSERDLMDRRLLEVVWRSLWGSRLRTQRWVGVARRQIAPQLPRRRVAQYHWDGDTPNA